MLVTAGSVDFLGNALEEMARLSPEERRAMGVRGRERVLSNHHPQKQAEKLDSLFRRAIEAHP